MDYSSSEPLEYQQSEEYRPYELSSNVDDKLKPKNCENTLKLNNLNQNVNSSLSHTSTNPSAELAKLLPGRSLIEVQLSKDQAEIVDLW